MERFIGERHESLRYNLGPTNLADPNYRVSHQHQSVILELSRDGSCKNRAPVSTEVVITVSIPTPCAQNFYYRCSVRLSRPYSGSTVFSPASFVSASDPQGGEELGTEISGHIEASAEVNQIFINIVVTSSIIPKLHSLLS